MRDQNRIRKLEEKVATGEDKLVKLQESATGTIMADRTRHREELAGRDRETRERVESREAERVTWRDEQEARGLSRERAIASVREMAEDRLQRKQEELESVQGDERKRLEQSIADLETKLAEKDELEKELKIMRDQILEKAGSDRTELEIEIQELTEKLATKDQELSLQTTARKADLDRFEKLEERQHEQDRERDLSRERDRQELRTIRADRARGPPPLDPLGRAIPAFSEAIEGTAQDEHWNLSCSIYNRHMSNWTGK